MEDLADLGAAGNEALRAIAGLAITEIFDISFLPNVVNPMMIGLRTAEIRELITFEPEVQTQPEVA